METQVEAKIIGVEKGCPKVSFRFNGGTHTVVIPQQASMSKITKNFSAEPICVIGFSFKSKKSRRLRVSNPKILFLLRRSRHRHIH